MFWPIKESVCCSSEGPMYIFNVMDVWFTCHLQNHSTVSGWLMGSGPEDMQTEAHQHSWPWPILIDIQKSAVCYSTWICHHLHSCSSHWPELCLPLQVTPPSCSPQEESRVPLFSERGRKSKRSPSLIWASLWGSPATKECQKFKFQPLAPESWPGLPYVLC